MAGDNKGDGIFRQRVSDGSTGTGIANYCCQLRIGNGFSEWDFSAGSQHLSGEGWQMVESERGSEFYRAAFEIGNYFVLEGFQEVFLEAGVM